MTVRQFIYNRWLELLSSKTSLFLTSLEFLGNRENFSFLIVEQALIMPSFSTLIIEYNLLTKNFSNNKKWAHIALTSDVNQAIK